jgi:hypothetical protein
MIFFTKYIFQYLKRIDLKGIGGGAFLLVDLYKIESDGYSGEKSK